MNPLPLLSICIPTHNRADTLRLTLENVLSEAEPLGARVEVVVSDNASTDHTKAVLAEFAGRIRQQSRPENIGYFPNTMKMTQELARGRYIWVLGDDDMILRGKLARVVDAIEAHPEVSLFYLNYSWIPVPERDDLIRHGNSQALPGPETCNFLTSESCTLERLEELALLPNRNSAGIFCAMFCYVLPSSFFREFGNSVVPLSFDKFSSRLDDIYPHSRILLGAFHGKPVRFIGEPCLLQGMGAWDWGKYAVFYKLTPLHQLLEYIETLGIEPTLMARMWTDFDVTAGRNLARLILDPVANHGIEVALAETVPRLGKHPAFWASFFRFYRANEGPDPEEALAHMFCHLFGG